MITINKITITGNLTKDSELTTVGQKGTSKLSFTIANNEGYGDNAKTTFVNCVLWGKSAENLSQYLTKGKKILVNGKLEIRSYEKDGVKKFITEIVCDMYNGIEFMGGATNSSNTSNDNFGEYEEPIVESEMPF